MEGEIFHGTVKPGAADVRVVNSGGVCHMCAQHMLEGMDASGNQCHIFVENHGYFKRNHHPSPFKAWPILCDPGIMGLLKVFLMANVKTAATSSLQGWDYGGLLCGTR